MYLPYGSTKGVKLLNKHLIYDCCCTFMLCEVKCVPVSMDLGNSREIWKKHPSDQRTHLGNRPNCHVFVYFVLFLKFCINPPRMLLLFFL